MTKQEYIEHQKIECRDRWFKNHQAAMPGDCDTNGVIIVINWQQPDSWNYGCRFIIHRRWLCVVGDIGEATFEWGEDLTLKFLGEIDFGYFLSKCRASPEGRKFEQFDSKVADHYRNERIADLKALADDDKSESHESELRILTENHGCDRQAWMEAAREYYDESSDSEGASEMADMGVVPSVHAIGMFVGLQMAIAQLTKP